METNNTVIIFQKGSPHLLSLHCNSEIQLKLVENYIHLQYYEQVVTALNGERLELQSTLKTKPESWWLLKGSPALVPKPTTPDSTSGVNLTTPVQWLRGSQSDSPLFLCGKPVQTGSSISNPTVKWQLLLKKISTDLPESMVVHSFYRHFTEIIATPVDLHF